MRDPSFPGSARTYIGEFRSRVAMQTRQVPDPFAEHPVRRSFIGVVGSLAVIAVPFAISDDAGTITMLAVGWFAMAVLVFSAPILLWSVGEWLVRFVTYRIHPPVDDLDVADRIVNILHRHGVHCIRDLQRMDDADLLLMSNMEPRDVRAVRQAASVWRYRRWQEAGFPASGAD